MKSFKDKYGAWGLVLGATDGVGKAMCWQLAERGLNVILVGRKADKMQLLAEELKSKHQIECKVVKEDLSTEGAIKRVIAAVEGLDIGFVSYVACLSIFSPFEKTSWEDQQSMMQINIVSFLECFHHFVQVFTKKGRGGIINISSLSGIFSSPYLAQYGAGKSFITKMTEAVAYEAQDSGVDIMVPILGSTLTPSFLASLPNTPEGEAQKQAAMAPEEVVAEIFEHFGKERTWIVGQRNRDSVTYMQTQKTPDEMVSAIGSMYK